MGSRQTGPFLRSCKMGSTLMGSTLILKVGQHTDLYQDLQLEMMMSSLLQHHPQNTLHYHTVSFGM
jgi:hypothetical protein